MEYLRPGALPVWLTDHLDLGEGLGRVLGNEDLYRRMLTTFLASFPAQRGALFDAMGRADSEGVRQVAHAVRGSAATLGARGLAGRAEALEKALLHGADNDTIVARAEDFLDALLGLEAVLGILLAEGMDWSALPTHWEHDTRLKG